jgi:hypothetical protein
MLSNSLNQRSNCATKRPLFSKTIGNTISTLMNGSNVSHSGSGAVKGILLILVSLCVNFARAEGISFQVPFLEGHDIHYRTFNTITGPADGARLFTGMRLVTAWEEGSFIGISGSAVLQVNSEGDTHDLTDDHPELADWPQGLAYNSKSNSVALTTFGGEGSFYQRRGTTPWTVTASMNNEDIDSIVYRPADDSYWGLAINWGSGTATRLLQFSPQGNKLSSMTLPALPIALGPGSFKSELVATSGVIIVMIDRYPSTALQSSDRGRIYVINPDARTMTLTFEGGVRPAPELRITAPNNGMQFTQGANITLSAQPTNGTFASVTFLSDGLTLATVSAPTVAIFPPTYSFTWSNAPAGEHNLLAVGNGSGSSVTSAPVTIRVVAPAPNVSVVRDLPDTYSAGVFVSVRLTATPNAGANAWAIEEQPPAGWTLGQTGFDGRFDPATGKIKWGPFTDATARAIVYSIKPPTNSSGLKTFSGIVSVNGASKPITGDITIADALAFHPADAPPQDNRITVDELTAYAAAWKSGATWPRAPSPIQIAYVTRAGFLWKSGEQYRYVPTNTPPNCWVPLTNSDPRAFITAVAASEAIRNLPPAFTPGQTIAVTVQIHPGAGVQTYALEERPPKGWTIVDADGATASDGVIRFGPFFDSQQRTLTYHLTPKTTFGIFCGEVSFDGSSDPIGGASSVGVPGVRTEHRDGHVYFRFNCAPGDHYIFETADSVDSANWHFEAEIIGAQTSIDVPAVEPSERQKFYRLRAVAP